MSALLLISILLIPMSLIPLFARDWWWKQHVKGQKRMGIKEASLARTPEWEKSTRNYGLFMLSMGIVGIIVSIIEFMF